MQQQQAEQNDTLLARAEQLKADKKSYAAKAKEHYQAQIDQILLQRDLASNKVITEIRQVSDQAIAQLMSERDSAKEAIIASGFTNADTVPRTTFTFLSDELQKLRSSAVPQTELVSYQNRIRDAEHRHAQMETTLTECKSQAAAETAALRTLQLRCDEQLLEIQEHKQQYEMPKDSR